MARLEEWSVIVASDVNAYTAPEMIRYHLAGKVYGRAGCEDGDVVETSSIVMLDVGERIAKTRHTTYYLGAPSEHWLEWLNANGHSLTEYNKK
jgi:hypothetical protein